MKHGLYKHRLFNVWGKMKGRCYTKSNDAYKNYGNRGIKICEKWLSDFKCFYDFAIGNGWKAGLEIDRIDNDGNYEPGNCRFVTRSVQGSNKRPCSSTGVKYVYKNGNVYIVRKQINGKLKNFGSFKTIQKAQNIAEEIALL